jgi:hypothetical protein
MCTSGREDKKACMQGLRERNEKKVWERGWNPDQVKKTISTRKGRDKRRS